MWLFKKKKIIDMTGRKLRVPVPSSISSQSGNVNDNDTVDMSNYADLTSPSSSSSSDSEDVSGLGFLGNMASAAGSNLNSGISSTNFSSDSGSVLNRDSPQHLKVKFEDVEYKVNALKTRMDKILDRLDLAEKKIERWDRR